jgi:hypothetical protein
MCQENTYRQVMVTYPSTQNDASSMECRKQMKSQQQHDIEGSTTAASAVKPAQI